MFQKQATHRSEAWRRAVASLPCACCWKDGPSQAAHPNHRGKGMGMKAPDCWCVPLCPECHREFDAGTRWHTLAQAREAGDDGRVDHSDAVGAGVKGIGEGMKVIKYTVKVEATVVETSIIGKRWEKGGPIERSESSEYGYTPEVESTVTRNQDIYTQTVENLDMASLVRVVNGIA